MKSLGKGETAWLRAEKAKAGPFYLGSVIDAIRRSQFMHWHKHGNGSDWEQEFYQPWTIDPFFGEAPGLGGFLRNWSEVFNWYRAEAEYRLRSMRDAYAAAKLALLGEVQQLEDLTEEEAAEGTTLGAGVSLFAPAETILAQVQRLQDLTEDEAEGSAPDGAVERPRGPAEEEAVKRTAGGSLLGFIAWALAQPEGQFPDGVGLRVGRLDAARVFWEFEAFAQNVRSVLDTLVRLVAPSYPQAIPVSISKFSKRNFTGEVAAELKAAWVQWGHRLGEYRDCVVHYTPLKVDMFVQGVKVAGEWRVALHLPDNPSARHLSRFRFAGQVDVLVYSEGVLKSLDRLSYKIAGLLLHLWRHGLYPLRPGPYFA